MSNQEQKEIDRVRQFCMTFTIVFVALIVGMTYYVTKQRLEDTAKIKPKHQQEQSGVKVMPASVNK